MFDFLCQKLKVTNSFFYFIFLEVLLPYHAWTGDFQSLVKQLIRNVKNSLPDL